MAEQIDSLQRLVAQLSKLPGIGRKSAQRLAYFLLAQPKEEAEALEAKLKDLRFCVQKVRWGEKRKNPSPPFTTSNLQQEAVRKLGFTTKKTMQIAQALYEGVDVKGSGTIGLISYIRTDSTRLSDEAVAAARARIAQVYPPEYLPETPNVFKGRKNAPVSYTHLTLPTIA